MVPDLAGVLCYGATRDQAIAHVQALALRVLAERLDHSEAPAEFLHVSFLAAWAPGPPRKLVASSRLFFIVQKEKGFYGSLTEFMSSGPVVIMVLEAENAVKRWRDVMGATDPALAKPGTIRHAHGFSIERNAVHGSDARETAEWEINYFFKK